MMADKAQGAGNPKGGSLSSPEIGEHFPGEVIFLLRPEG